MALHATGTLSHGGWAPLLAAVAVLFVGILCAGFMLVNTLY